MGESGEIEVDVFVGKRNYGEESGIRLETCIAVSCDASFHELQELDEMGHQSDIRIRYTFPFSQGPVMTSINT
jgi:hypothetical protein